MKEPTPYLAAYDISNPRRLYKAHRILLDYAIGRQKSVFECWLLDGQKSELIKRISEVIDPSEDRFVLIRLDPRCSKKCLGCAAIEEKVEIFYVG